MTVWNRKPPKDHGVASAVVDKRRSENEPHRVSADFGQRALELADEVGKTRQDLINAAGSVSTFNRLLRGDGSPLSAIKVKNALRAWGADVTSLPAIDADDGTHAAEEPLREGFELLRRLYQLADDAKFRYELDRLHKIIDAYKLIAEGTDKLKPRRP